MYIYSGSWLRQLDGVAQASEGEKGGSLRGVRAPGRLLGLGAALLGGSKAPQDASKSLLFRLLFFICFSMMLQDASKTTQEASKTAQDVPRRFFGANMGLCWGQHGPMLALKSHSEGILC